MTRSVSNGHEPVTRFEGPRLTRRELLALSVAAGLLSGLPRAASAVEPAAEPLLEVIPNRAAAEVLGRAYLAAHPSEADPERLRALLSVTLNESGPTESSVRVRIEQQLRTDYIRGDLVEVDGWILSRTEARLYALAAL